MAMLTPSFESWNQQVAAMVRQLGGVDFFRELVAAIEQTVAVDHPQVWLYRRDQVPVALYFDIAGEEQSVQIDSYIDGSYQLDPFYLATLNHQQSPGVYRLTELSAGGFQQSDYYRSYYAHLDTADEIVYMVDVDESMALHISLMRSQSSRRFSDQELGFLRAIEPVVRELVLQHAAISPLADTVSDDAVRVQPGFEKSVNRAFDLFGRSLLTGREKDVLGLMLQGHSTKLSAEKLGISPETLRRHRKNIYQKLDVSSQTELFSLFINSLGCFEQAPTQDPLSLYFRRPTQNSSSN